MKYAMVMTCNKGYEFGMIATINAQIHFGTYCDFHIAYEDFTEEDRKRISRAFDGRVFWTHLPELLVGLEDNRTDKRYPVDRFWIGYWLLADKILKEGHYESVCVTQADQFTFVNLNPYFDLASMGYLIVGEWDQHYLSARSLPFGSDKAVCNREQCAIFDNLTFLGLDYIDLPLQVVKFQHEDAFEGESNHSVIALNRAVCKYGSGDMTIGLSGREWLHDLNWHDARIITKQGELWDSTGLQLKGIHNRWWQEGRAEADLKTQEKTPNYEVLKHNYNEVKHFMEYFNSMTKTAMSDNYVKGLL